MKVIDGKGRNELIAEREDTNNDIYCRTFRIQ